MESQYILAVDIGTSFIRCHVYDNQADLLGSAAVQNQLLYPQPGWVELDPNTLWANFVTVVNNAIKDAKISSHDCCMGISTLRNTFITWDRDSGTHFHNFILWNDLRADSLVHHWNSSLSMRSIRFGAKLLHKITGQTRYLAASVLQLDNKQISMRLLWALTNIPRLRQQAENGKAMFGTIETWLLWKLTGGEVHATDYSCASSTALYDPFILDWGYWAFNLFKIPFSMMPEIKDTSGHFGTCKADIFGSPIPILAMAGDQQAATFGLCCFEVGDVKCTMGTGSFIDINTGLKPHASVKGLYPLVGWKYGSSIVYLAEGSSNDTGVAINWAQSLGIVIDPSDSSSIAQSIQSTGGVFFIPAFSGLQAPYNDNNAVAGLLGIKPCTSKPEILRAILESLAYRFHQLYEVIENEANFPLKDIRASGGVAKNDFVLQLIADLTGKDIMRMSETEMSCLGIAFLTGLAAGIWKNVTELKLVKRIERVFKPGQLTENQITTYNEWGRAVKRFLNWEKSNGGL